MHVAHASLEPLFHFFQFIAPDTVIAPFHKCIFNFPFAIYATEVSCSRCTCVNWKVAITPFAEECCCNFWHNYPKWRAYSVFQKFLFLFFVMCSSTSRCVFVLATTVDPKVASTKIRINVIRLIRCVVERRVTGTCYCLLPLKSQGYEVTIYKQLSSKFEKSQQFKIISSVQS